jgi:hypothetical protein
MARTFLQLFYYHQHNFHSWLRHYAVNRKVVDWDPDEVIRFILIYLISPAALWPCGCLSL